MEIIPFKNQDQKILINFFDELEKQKSILIYKADSLAKDGPGFTAWNTYKALENLLISKAKELFINNNRDNKYDAVHYAILCDDKTIAKMPPGYKATIIVSYYNSILKHYTTIAKVITPKNDSYFVSVPTFDKVLAGTRF